jgi:hypothetical protein
MNRFSIFLFLIATAVLALSACSPSKTIGTKGEESYSENIEQNRNAYTDSLKSVIEGTETSNNIRPNPETPSLSADVNTTYDINEVLDEFLEEVSEHNAENNTYQGYTIQVYTGSSREKANEAKNAVYDLLPDANPAISFDPPNYKVKVGEFTDRLEAQPVFAKLKGKFPVVLIVPERFTVNKED